MQPKPDYAPPKPNNHLVWAILTTIFCCLPFGIPAIVYASKVDGQYATGDYQGAEDSAKKAKTWSLVGTIVGGICIALYFVIIVVGLMASPGDMYY